MNDSLDELIRADHDRKVTERERGFEGFAERGIPQINALRLSEWDEEKRGRFGKNLCESEQASHAFSPLYFSFLLGRVTIVIYTVRV